MISLKELAEWKNRLHKLSKDLQASRYKWFTETKQEFERQGKTMPLGWQQYHDEHIRNYKEYGRSFDRLRVMSLLRFYDEIVEAIIDGKDCPNNNLGVPTILLQKSEFELRFYVKEGRFPEAREMYLDRAGFDVVKFIDDHYANKG